MSLDFYLQYEIDENEIEVFDINITHNLGKMAEAAGIYKALWRPEEIGCTYAKDIIPILITGYAKLTKNPGEYKLLDSPNGWGVYENFTPFVSKVLEACQKYPNAKIKISR